MMTSHNNYFKFFALTIFAAFFALPYQAKAGEGVLDLVQTTCIPELNYFALRTIELSRDLPNSESIDKEKFASLLKRLQSQNQMYSTQQLLKQPYECKLPNRIISIKIEDYVAPHEKGMCALMENFSISVWVDKNKIGEFPAYGLDRCAMSETHSVELNAFNLFKDCTFEEGNKNMSCRHKRL